MFAAPDIIATKEVIPIAYFTLSFDIHLHSMQFIDTSSHSSSKSISPFPQANSH